MAARVDQPLLTYCDEVAGERIELTAQQLGGWVARTAGCCRTAAGLIGEARVAVLLPPLKGVFKGS